MTPAPRAARALAMGGKVPGSAPPAQGGSKLRMETPGVPRSRREGKAGTGGKVTGTKEVPELEKFVNKANGIIDAKEWYTTFEEHARRHEWDDEMRRRWASKGVESHDRAKRWNRQEGVADMDWDDWTEAFLREFGNTPATRQAARRAWYMVQQAKGETVEMYYSRFLRLQQKAVTDGGQQDAAEEEEACSKFVEGLQEPVKSLVGVPGSGETVAEIRARAATAEAWRPSRARPSTTNQAHIGGVRQQTGSNEGQGGAAEVNMSNMCRRCTAGAIHTAATCPNKDGSVATGHRCGACGEVGHYPVSCEKKKQGVLFCDHCKSTTHVTGQHRGPVRGSSRN